MEQKLSAPQLDALNQIAEASRMGRRIWRWVGGMTTSRHKSAEALEKRGLVKRAPINRSVHLTWRMTPAGWKYRRALGLA